MSKIKTLAIIGIVVLASCLSVSADEIGEVVFTLPQSSMSKTLKVLQISGDNEAVIHNQLHKPGERVTLKISGKSVDKIKFFLNGILMEERSIVAKAQTVQSLPALPAFPVVAPPATIAAPIVAKPDIALPASKPQSSDMRIITGVSVRLRDTPSKSGKERGFIELGTVVKIEETSANEDTISKIKSPWYRTILADGTNCWLFGGFTRPFSPADKETIYLKLARERWAKTSKELCESFEIFKFCRRAASESVAVEVKAELELLELLAFQRFLSEYRSPVTSAEKDPKIKEYADMMVFCEPAGAFFVRAERFWDLYERNKNTAISDRLAWEAAGQSLPGETEGFLEAIFALRMATVGKYLLAQPSGKHVGEALKDIDEAVPDTSGREKADFSDRLPEDSEKDATNSLNELRSAVEKVQHKDREKILKKIDAFIDVLSE